MSLEETLTLKNTNLEKLIRNADKAIQDEMHKYENAELYIRLQSECYGLYPVVSRALALQIVDKKRRSIFCSIVKGHNLERLATYYKQTPEETVQEFLDIVCELQRRVNNGAFTAKESVTLRMQEEWNRAQSEVRHYKEQNKKLQLVISEQNNQIWTLEKNKRRQAESEWIFASEKELEIRRKVRKELQEEMNQEMKQKMEMAHVSIGTRCVRWIKMVCSQL